MIQTVCKEASHPKISESSDLLVQDDIEMEMYDDFDDITALREQWDSFMVSINAEIFLSFDWCRIWWKYYSNKRDLFILVYRHRGLICGLFPFFYEKIRLGPFSLRIVKMVGTDYVPVTVTMPINEKFVAPIINKLIPALQMKWKWDLLYLGALSGRYTETVEFIDLMRKRMGGSFNIDTLSDDIQIYFDVVDTWDQYVEALAKKQRTNSRRTYREIDKMKIEVKCSLATKENLSRMIDNFIKMHQAYWNQARKPGHFGAWPNSAAFHCEVAEVMADADRLRLMEIRFNNQPVGYEYVYKLSSTYYWFLNARAASLIDVGIDYKWVSHRVKMENAWKDDVKYIDGMRGKYEYKLLLGGNAKQVNKIFIYPNRALTAARVHVFRTLVSITNIWYSKLWRARIAPRLSYMPKTFWDKWIKIHMLSNRR